MNISIIMPIRCRRQMSFVTLLVNLNNTRFLISGLVVHCNRFSIRKLIRTASAFLDYFCCTCWSQLLTQHHWRTIWLRYKTNDVDGVAEIVTLQSYRYLQRRNYASSLLFSFDIRHSWRIRPFHCVLLSRIE